ncbi:hypothetical protein ACFC4G_44780 [Streptomyces sp. NPDC056002]
MTRGPAWDGHASHRQPVEEEAQALTRAAAIGGCDVAQAEPDVM